MVSGERLMKQLKARVKNDLVCYRWSIVSGGDDKIYTSLTEY